MRRPVLRKPMLAALCGGLLILGACTSINEMLFGAVETEAREAYQEKAKYVYVAIPARVGAMSIAEMRIWRKQFVEKKSEDFVANRRDSTEEEWAQLDAKVDEIRGAIQMACAAPT